MNYKLWLLLNYELWLLQFSGKDKYKSTKFEIIYSKFRQSQK